jgi:hypothetical protein
MVGTGARLYLALGAISLLAALVYGVASEGDPMGVLSAGYKGGVGEHFGYAVLLTAGVVALVVGVIMIALRDADPVPVSADAVPEVMAPASASPWPMVGAFGAVVLLLGLVVNWLLFTLGVILLVVTIVEWTVAAWADRATGDPDVNRTIRNRMMAPVEIPVGAALVIAFIVIGVSRVLLAVSATTAWVLGSILAIVIISAAVIVATRPGGTRKLVVALLVLGGLAVLGGGIAGVAAGSREVHEEAPASEAGE